MDGDSFPSPNDPFGRAGRVQTEHNPVARRKRELLPSFPQAEPPYFRHNPPLPVRSGPVLTLEVGGSFVQCEPESGLGFPRHEARGRPRLWSWTSHPL